MAPASKPKARVRAYTTRKMPSELLERLRVLAAVKSAEDGRRCTLEWIVNEALRIGLAQLESEILR